MSMTIDEVNNLPPMTDAELETAKKNDMKLKNFTDNLTDLGVVFEVIPLRQGMPAA